MKNLTLRETVDNHRVLWNWLTDETLKRKRKVQKKEYFVEHGVEECDFPRNLCYCCEYNISNISKGQECSSCPIDWKGKCYYTESLYRVWYNETDYIKAAKLAREIANLPLKPKFTEQYENECREKKL